MSLRKALRFLLKIREKESIEDGLRRHKNEFLQMLPHKKYSGKTFQNDLKKLGIEKGDVIIIHASWKGLFALELNPEEAIDVLLDTIGEKGTIVMPCYGDKDEVLDIEKSKSSAGILSELLRTRKGSIRSIFPKFSMVAYGYAAKEIVERHMNSLYQFDENSPYYIAMNKYKAKVLLLGLGKTTHKISVFHCATYKCKDMVPFYKKCFTKKCNKNVLMNKEVLSFEYLDREDNCSNNRRIFKKVFGTIPKQRICKIGYSIIIFNSYEAYNIAYDFCLNGGKFYKY